MKYLFFYIFIVFSCTSLLKPNKTIQENKQLLAPDYTDLKFWAAHPNKKDFADLVPKNSGFVDRQDIADADVFFIHPTTYLKSNFWNGDLADETLNKRTEEGTIKQQASVFNDCCKVFAPRYRQASIYVFLKESEEGKKALDFAYQDILQAFTVFQKSYNKGRPWILASHSQGTHHASRLLAEVISKSEMGNSMVAAYTIGWPYKSSETGFPVCKTKEQTGCLLNWSTYVWDKEPTRLKDSYKDGFCVNPLSWNADNSYIPKEKNPGSMPISYDKIIPEMADAKCQNGILWTNKVVEGGFPTLELGKNYHRVDIHLFYKSIRENATLRVKTFIEEKNKRGQ